jgi:peptide/nickel transport system substrate-binding protein
VLSYDKGKDVGLFNSGGYSNPEIDGLVIKAYSEPDVNKRKQIQEEAMALLVNDFGIIPLHAQMTIMATKPGLVYKPRMDENTEAMNCRPAK